MKARFIVVIAIAAAPALSQGGFVTTVIRDAGARLSGNTLMFDLSAVPEDANVCRAVLRVPTRGHTRGASVRVQPILPDAKPLRTRPPDHVTFDAMHAVRAWLKTPPVNKGFKVIEAAGVNFSKAALEVSYEMPDLKAQAFPVVKDLKAIHQSGQTFLTWTEPVDVVGNDAPIFEEFEKSILQARKSSRTVYRVYRHDKRITGENIGDAELIHEVQDSITCWDLLSIRVTEHPNQGTPTKRSPLRGGNLARNHVMTRYRIADERDPLPCGTAVAVNTVREAGRRYYAVTVAIDGAERVSLLGDDSSLAQPIDEKPSPFPATIRQRRSGGVDPHKGKRPRAQVETYMSWLGPPFDNKATLSHTFIVRFGDTPKGEERSPVPLLTVTGTYGGSATTIGNPGWHMARRHVPGTLRVAVTQGGVWQGRHECIGTLRGYDQGSVHNYPQRRVLGAARWALWRKDLYVDEQRIYFWSQLGGWALRHGDLFAVVMSNGQCNPAVAKLMQKHGWEWGPYPKGSKNWLGIDQWEYMNIAKWVRDNPTQELPYWVCWPAYGAYPSHTIGDFGFLPWPEMLHAMASTKRAFAATWSSNGSGAVRGLVSEQVPRIRRDQALPAFSSCSLDTSPGDGDHADSEKRGGINIHQRWLTDDLVDEAGRWAATLYLAGAGRCTTHVTPRRCQQFNAKAGETFGWKLTEGDQMIAEGKATADKWGLVTVESIQLRTAKRRLTIEK